jgi:CheY-like chemotaxis protein
MSSRPRPLVLVVDDCDCVREMITFVLRRMMGVRVMGAENSAEGLRLARRRKFDLVTTDINRPGMNGLSFLRVFKRVQPTTPVIVISGVLDEATARWARWLRAFDCLPEPFAAWELVGMVQAAIASRRVCRTVSRGREHITSRMVEPLHKGGKPVRVLPPSSKEEEGGFEFHPELFECRSRASEILDDAGFAWFSDYGSIDLLHEEYGLEVCGIRDKAKVEPIAAAMRAGFPHWHYCGLWQWDCGCEPGWHFAIHRFPRRCRGNRWIDAE